MKFSWEDVFRVVLQEIDTNPDIYTSDIVIKIEDKLKRCSSEELSKIDRERKSICKDIELLDKDYLQRIKNLDEDNGRKVERCNEQYRLNTELLERKYSANLTRLMPNNHQNIILVQANCQKTSGLQLRYESKSGVSNYESKSDVSNKVKLFLLNEEHKRESEKAECYARREKLKLEEKYNKEYREAKLCHEKKKGEYNNMLKELSQQYHSIEQVVGECNVWKESGLDINYAFKVQGGSNNNLKVYTLLHFAVDFGNIKVTKLLLEKEANLNAVNQDGDTPLHLSAAKGNTGMVKLLVEREACLDVGNKQGNTPLHLSAVKGHIGIVELLVEKGADLNAVNKVGDAPLHLSANNNHIEIVKLLVEKGANVDIKDQNEDTPLHLSAVKGHIGIAELLVEKEADLNAVNKAGDTPLHLSANNNYIEIVKLLVEKGANIHLVDKDGNTSLHNAFYKNYPKIVRYLMAKEPTMKVVVDSLVRCVVEDRTHTLLKGRTPLHLAAIYNCTEVVESLLAEGENPLLKDANGKTPRELATDESLIQLFGEAEIKQQEYNATKWGVVSGGSAGALGITVATTLFAADLTQKK